MKYVYNYQYSQKVRKNNALFLIICLLLGITISLIQMSSIFDIKVILISLIFAITITFLLIYFLTFKNWHKIRNDYSLLIEENIIKKCDIHGIQEININEIKKALFLSKNNQVVDIILIGNKKYKINNFFDNIEKISIEIKKILEKNNIEIEYKKNTIIPTIFTAIVAITVLILSYYYQFTGNTQLIRSLSNKIIPIAGGIMLIFLPKQEKGFIRGNRKYILSAFMIIISVVQIVMEIT